MRSQKGFSVIEYALLLVVFIAALIGMSIYLKRAVMAKWRDAADVFGFGRQYDSDTQTRIIPANEAPP